MSLKLDVEHLFHAFALVEPYATGKSNKQRLDNQKLMALGLVDWAITESNRGRALLEARAELAARRADAK